MKAISVCMLFAMVLFATVSYAGAGFQQAGAGAGVAAQGQDEKVFEGVLMKIDPDNHILTLTGPDNREMQFTYTDATQVTAPENAQQGLAGRPGSRLKVSYKVDEGKNVATRIEILPEK